MAITVEQGRVQVSLVLGVDRYFQYLQDAHGRPQLHAYGGLPPDAVEVLRGRPPSSCCATVRSAPAREHLQRILNHPRLAGR